MLCVKNGNYVKCFKSNGKHPLYIPKSKRSLAETLAVKKYYTLQIEELLQEITLLDQCLERYRRVQPKYTELLAPSSCYCELLKPYFQAMSEHLSQWPTADYNHNPNYPEHLIHKTLSGHKVRSKSEVMIANALFLNKIPYRYECELSFDSLTFYPDFTILHPKTMELFYWEHFGMMDNPSYCEKAFNKLKIYGSNGIIPSLNLITSYETQDHPIDSENIQNIIDEYFLS